MRILVVEDEASLREGIVDLLTGDGHEVVAVGDGIAGVEAGLRDPFDLVVLDLMLPRLPAWRSAGGCGRRGPARRSSC